MLYEADEAGKVNWVTKIKNALLSYGFGIVWYNQGVENIDVFLKEFKRRLLDCEIQDWSSRVAETSKLEYYNMYKTLYEPELYLHLNIPRKLKVGFAKLRMSSHKLEIEIGRQTDVLKEDRLCKACGKLNIVCVECEYHVIMKCCLYKDIRDRYLHKVIHSGSLNEFYKLMGTQNCETLVSLTLFIQSMFKIRNNFLSTLSL